MDYDMAYFDMESSRVQALENPFGPKVLGVWAVKSVNHVLGTNCKGCNQYVPSMIWPAQQESNLRPTA
jgi:hypothetical protein